jgi:predicted DsbA family dithiol-disulfide isomerase
MSSILVEFFYDYVDPLSWLVERRLAEALVRPPKAPARLRLMRQPLELRPPPALLMAPDDPELVDRRRAVAAADPALGSRLCVPDLVPWTRKAHELALHAESVGRFDRVHTALFNAHLSDGLDIGRVDVLVRIASDEALEPAETKAVLDVDRYLERMREIRSDAMERGIDRVPTVLVDGAALSVASMFENPSGSVLDWLD